jgi:hypothetical protein
VRATQYLGANLASVTGFAAHGLAALPLPRRARAELHDVADRADGDLWSNAMLGIAGCKALRFVRPHVDRQMMAKVLTACGASKTEVAKWALRQADRQRLTEFDVRPNRPQIIQSADVYVEPNGVVYLADYNAGFYVLQFGG